MPSRLVVWRLVGDSAVQEWSHEPERWGPSDARWLAPECVTFTAHHLGPEDPGPIRRTIGTLVRERGAWRLRAP